MSIGFLNIAMLAGLTAVALPVLVHLLSKRRYNVEQWGAMQFLRLGQRTRRRIRIQDILLLLLRMALLACLAMALARPWGQGSLFGVLANSVSRDVVFVIDGSTSMDWRGGDEVPHKQAIEWVHAALEDLRPGDTVALIDSRSQNRRLIHPPTSDFSRVRSALDQLPEPTGRSNLASAVLDAIQILSATANVSREVIVLTDFQGYPWNLEDEFVRQRIDDLLEQPAMRPTISVVNLSEDDQDRTNCSVAPIQLSRKFTVPGFPIQFQTTIRQSGGEVTQKEVFLAVNGQRSPESTRSVHLLPDGEAIVDFTQSFPENGYYRISISLEEDSLPQDDAAEAVVVVEDGIPVLLVDGDRHEDETKSDSFFLSAAFASSGNESTWIRSQRIEPRNLDGEALASQRVVVLCNVERLTSAQESALAGFVQSGGGLIVAPGKKTDPQAWNDLMVNETLPLLPATLNVIESEATGDDAPQITIDSFSLNETWLDRFKKEHGVDFWLARFSRWWELVPHPQEELAIAVPETDEESSAPTTSSTPVTLARLTNNRPLIVSHKIDEGTVVLLAAPLDADWSTLPARTDFVPFVHELVFQLAGMDVQHNVDVGAPLRMVLKEDERPRDFSVTGPTEHEATPILKREGRKSYAVFDQTSIPGTYTFLKKNSPQAKPVPYVVVDDSDEADLTPLDELDWETLSANERMGLIESMSERTALNQSNFAQTELWWVLLLVMLLMLVCEVYLTRRMVHGGHTDLTSDASSAAGDLFHADMEHA